MKARTQVAIIFAMFGVAGYFGYFDSLSEPFLLPAGSVYWFLWPAMALTMAGLIDEFSGWDSSSWEQKRDYPLPLNDSTYSRTRTRKLELMNVSKERFECPKCSAPLSGSYGVVECEYCRLKVRVE